MARRKKFSGNYCTCKRCKKARKKGLEFNTRPASYWFDWGYGPFLWCGRIDAYVPMRNKRGKRIDIECHDG